MTSDTQIDFDQLSPQIFVELCADVLKSISGFKNISLGGKGQDLGCDIYAEEDLVTHSGYSETIRWLVQCKHYAKSNRSVSHSEIGDLIGYLDTHDADGLFIITDTDLSGTAAKKLREFNSSKRHPYRARYWNRYELESRLQSVARHLLSKYFNRIPSGLRLWPGRGLIEGIEVLAFPDMSIMSYQVIRRLYEYGLKVTVFSDHASDLVRLLSLPQVSEKEYDLAILFRSELFNFPIGPEVQVLIRNHVRRKRGLILSPWAAWTVNAGKNSWLADIVPVNVTKMDSEHFEHHEEDVHLKWLPLMEHPVLTDIEPFSFRTTREFLAAKEGACVIAEDSDLNPAIVVSESTGARVVYINSCSHNCLRMGIMPSPFENNDHLERLFWNSILWASRRW